MACAVCTIPVCAVLCAAVFVIAPAVSGENDDHCSRTYLSDSSRCAANCHTFNVGDTPVSIYRATSPSGKELTPITRIPSNSDGRKPNPVSLFISMPRCLICPKEHIIEITVYTGQAALDNTRTSPATPDHQHRTWYDVWKDFWISIAITAFFVLWFLLETGVIVCGLALVGSMIWITAGRILTPCLLDAMGLFLLSMSAVSYWYIMELLRSRGFMLQVELSHSDQLAARMYLTF